jgi:3-deoxy-D-manno-octulosonic-acid transferase
MLFLYNILQVLLIVIFLPLIATVFASRPRYRRHILERLGLGELIPSPVLRKKTVWVHALSVGEVTSSLPLIRGIREAFDVTLIFSATTRTGSKLAEEIIAPHVDRIVLFPVDIMPVIQRFLKLIHPDLFILVETDFWPNLLSVLHKKGIPSLLVNGRISRKSMGAYRRCGFFFRPLFRSFSALSMQTAMDRDNMISLGISEDRIFNLGNLKFDTPILAEGKNCAPDRSPGVCLVAGSTHRGEEELLLAAYRRLKKDRRALSLVIAPRDISRKTEIQHLAESLGLVAVCRSQGRKTPWPDLLILDTIGELAAFYQSCDIAFIGGSLVDQGGHNPIEPAVMGLPVLFGPHMEDFGEIAEDLIAAGGAIRVPDGDALFLNLERLLDDPAFRQATGKAAAVYVKGKKGVVTRHLALIRKFL